MGLLLPQSGAISFSDLQNNIGGASPISLSEYYAGGSYLPGYYYVNHDAGLSGKYGAGAPSSGTISINSLRRVHVANSWPNASGTPLGTPWGSNVYSGWWSLANVLDSTALQPGRTVYVNAYKSASWGTYPHLTATITIGSASSPSLTYGGKAFNYAIEYDGGTNIRLHGWYTGPSTNSPNGAVYLEGVGGTA